MEPMQSEPRRSEARGGLPGGGHRGRPSTGTGRRRSRSRTVSPSLFTLTVTGPEQFICTLTLAALQVALFRGARVGSRCCHSQALSRGATQMCF